jgi:hypothetical protein
MSMMELWLTLSYRGFAAKAPAKVLETVQTWGNDYHGMCFQSHLCVVISRLAFQTYLPTPFFTSTYY